MNKLIETKWKWLVRLAIIGVLLILQIPFGAIFRNVFEWIGRYLENWGNFLGSISGGNIFGGILVVGFLIFVLGGFITALCLDYYESEIMCAVLFFGCVIGALILCPLEIDVSKEVQEINQYQVSNLSLENIQIKSNTEDCRFAVKKIASFSDKTSTIYNVSFDLVNSDNTDLDTTLEMEQSLYNEVVGGDNNSVSGQVYSINLSMPYNTTFEKDELGNQLTLTNDYIHIKLIRYSFLNEQPFSENEIENIKKSFLSAIFKYKNGEIEAFSAFSKMSGIHSFNFKTYTENKTWKVEHSAWNSITGKKALEEIGIIFE